MTAEQIVRALAAADPSHSSERGTLHRCTFCQKTNDWPRVIENAADHESDCPWRLAVEWVAARDAVATVVDSRAAANGLRKMAAALERMATSFGAHLAKIRGRYVLVVPDPADERPTSLAAWADQAWAILRHDFWVAAGQPERAPGARWERRR